MTTILAGVDEVRSAVGRHLGFSEWVAIDQARIDRFADATDDRQWIHVDHERAAAGPFRSTIAHGFLTLSMSNRFLPEIVEVRGFAAGVNYGVDRVRFPAPVPVGARLRAGAELLAVSDVANGIQTVMRITIEVDGDEKPACVIDAVSRWLE